MVKRRPYRRLTLLELVSDPEGYDRVIAGTQARRARLPKGQSTLTLHKRVVSDRPLRQRCLRIV